MDHEMTDAEYNNYLEMRAVRSEIADICSTIYGAEDDLTAAELHEFLGKLTLLNIELGSLEKKEI